MQSRLSAYRHGARRNFQAIIVKKYWGIIKLQSIIIASPPIAAIAAGRAFERRLLLAAKARAAVPPSPAAARNRLNRRNSSYSILIKSLSAAVASRASYLHNRALCICNITWRPHGAACVKRLPEKSWRRNLASSGEEIERRAVIKIKAAWQCKWRNVSRSFLLHRSPDAISARSLFVAKCKHAQLTPWLKLAVYGACAEKLQYIVNVRQSEEMLREAGRRGQACARLFAAIAARRREIAHGAAVVAEVYSADEARKKHRPKPLGIIAAAQVWRVYVW